jgi:NAD(P)-dependent dehydrogenase (short-subunit alcohol dehydrogenase family)
MELIPLPVELIPPRVVYDLLFLLYYSQLQNRKDRVMHDFKDKVAVITGAASGIGRGLAIRCVEEKMKVVLADVEAGALEKTRGELEKLGGQVIAVHTDVSRLKEIEQLAEKTLESFGGVHCLFNNAGVGAGTSVWESTYKDWQWVLGVNLNSVIYACRTFIPVMLNQDTECHIINTASIAGVVSGPGMVTYKVSKHGLVAYSETLYHELTMGQTKIGVSLLCPGTVKTNIMTAERNRPERFRNTISPVIPPMMAMAVKTLTEQVKNGMPPAQVADMVFAAIREKKFYVFTHPELKDAIKIRMEDILQERNPTFYFTG